MATNGQFGALGETNFKKTSLICEGNSWQIDNSVKYKSAVQSGNAPIPFPLVKVERSIQSSLHLSSHPA